MEVESRASRHHLAVPLSPPFINGPNMTIDFVSTR